MALLWGIEYDLDCAGGYSGTVLCHDVVTDSEVQAVVFQEFQVPV